MAIFAPGSADRVSCGCGRPADDAPRMQVENDGQIQPTVTHPYVADIGRPFWFGRSAVKLRSRRVGYVECVTAVRRRFELHVLSNAIPFSRISRPTLRCPTSTPTSFSSSVILRRPPKLRRDCSLMWARTTMCMRCLRLAGRQRKARNPRALTFITRHSQSTGKAPHCSSTSRNLRALRSSRNWGAFFRMSLSSLRMRVSRRSRSFSRAKEECPARQLSDRGG